MFAGKNSLGKSFKINGKNYKVIGVLRYKEPENMGPQSQDINTRIYLLITEILDRKEDKKISQILAKATSSQDVEHAGKIIKNTLKENHPKGNFSVLKQKDILNAINNILGALTAGL